MDINTGKYELGDGGKKPKWVDLRKPNPRAPYGVKNSDKLCEKYGITEAEASKIWSAVRKKLTYKKPLGATIEQYENYVKPFILPTILWFYKNWRVGYELLIKSKIKIHLIRDNWIKVDHRPSIYPYFESAGFVNPYVEPYKNNSKYDPDIYINICDKNIRNREEFNNTVRHETIHAILIFILNKISKKHFALTEGWDRKLNEIFKNYIKREKPVIKKMGNFSKKKHLDESALNALYAKLAAKNFLWGGWVSYYNYSSYDIPELKDIIPLEVITGGLMCYLDEDKREILKYFEPKLYNLIEKEMLPFTKDFLRMINNPKKYREDLIFNIFDKK